MKSVRKSDLKPSSVVEAPLILEHRLSVPETILVIRALREVPWVPGSDNEVYLRLAVAERLEKTLAALAKSL